MAAELMHNLMSVECNTKALALHQSAGVIASVNKDGNAKRAHDFCFACTSLKSAISHCYDVVNWTIVTAAHGTTYVIVRLWLIFNSTVSDVRVDIVILALRLIQLKTPSQAVVYKYNMV